jgi:hypothetical protein
VRGVQYYNQNLASKFPLQTLILHNMFLANECDFRALLKGAPRLRDLQTVDQHRPIKIRDEDYFSDRFLV